MGIMHNGRVNIVITNRVLRYSYHKRPNLDSLVDKGELEIPKDTIKDGTIVNPSQLIKILSDFVKEKRWKGKKVAFCLPDDTVVIRQLHIPSALSKEEAISYVRTQIGHSFHLPFEKPALAIEYLGEEKDQRNILLYAYPKEKVEAFKDVFEEAGLKPVIADLTSLSVYRYYYEQYKQTKEHVLHVQWNWDALILTAFHNHKAIFTRYVKLLDYQLKTELTNKELEDAISEYGTEIERIIDFYQYNITKGEAGIELVILSGDFPYLKEIEKSPKANLSVEIFAFPESQADLGFIDVLGLAMKQEG